MDYEKKYNHALKVVRELQKDWASTQNRAAREIELAFPELRESEDERIRKEIIDIVKSYRKNCITEGTHRFDDCLAYLEKQEQKPAWSEEDEEIIKFLEWLVGNHCWMGGVSRESVVHFLKDIRPQPKQMPADWTDKDKRILDDISHLLISFKYTEMAKAYKQAIEKLIYQPHWKPSERQLTKLYCIAEGIPDDDDAKVLMELYDDLLKLK